MNSQTVSKRILIIHNPAAGRGMETRLGAVERILKAGNCAVTLLASASPSHLASFFRDFEAGDWDVIAIAGGDGTFMEAINVLAHDSPVLALIATGTANVVALDLGLVVRPKHWRTSFCPAAQSNFALPRSMTGCSLSPRVSASTLLSSTGCLRG